MTRNLILLALALVLLLIPVAAVAQTPAPYLDFRVTCRPGEENAHFLFANTGSAMLTGGKIWDVATNVTHEISDLHPGQFVFLTLPRPARAYAWALNMPFKYAECVTTDYVFLPHIGR
jgi:hypothetical protein